MRHPSAGTTLVLFNHDFDRLAHQRLAAAWPQVHGGFDVFRFPSQIRLAWLNLEHMARIQAWRARLQGVKAVLSHHEHFGALTAALISERMGLPGTPVEAILACQHKLHARRVLQQVAPEANIPFTGWPDKTLNRGFIKPIKGVFSVLAREIRDEHDLARMSPQELQKHFLLRRLVEPFDRVARRRLPQAGPALGFLVEATVQAPQFNLDGYVFEGEVRHFGVVDSVMYPGTQAFMRFDYPSRLPSRVVARAVGVARRFLQAVGFTHGPFNMEFFHDAQTDQLTVIEFNPRLASQFSDLYERVDGINLHEVALALAHGRDPALMAAQAPTARVASSFVFRSFHPQRPLRTPTREQREVLQAAYPDALLMTYEKTPRQAAREFAWLGSVRHGILHLGGADDDDLRRHCEVASRLLGWTPPYADYHRSIGLAQRPAPTHPTQAQKEITP